MSLGPQVRLLPPPFCTKRFFCCRGQFTENHTKIVFRKIFPNVHGFDSTHHHFFTFLTISGCGWGWVLFVWLWSIAILLPIDLVKLGAEDFMRLIPPLRLPSNSFHNLIKKLPWRTRDVLNKHVLSEHYHQKPHQKKTGTRETKFAAADTEHRRSVQINRAAGGAGKPVSN